MCLSVEGGGELPPVAHRQRMLVAALCHFELTVLLFRNVALVTTANLRAISTIRGRITSIFAWDCEACADDERVGELSVGQFDGGVPLVAIEQIRPPPDHGALFCTRGSTRARSSAGGHN